MLKKEIQVGLDILASNKEVDETCAERLHIYCDNVETQIDKLAESICDSDTELTQQLLVENESVCDKAVECALNLKQK